MSRVTRLSLACVFFLGLVACDDAEPSSTSEPPVMINEGGALSGVSP